MRSPHFPFESKGQARSTHASHPSTASYVDRGDGRELGGYDGAQDAFGPPPRLAAGGGLSGIDGVSRHGLWIPSAALAESWSALVGAEARLDLSGYEAHSSHKREGGCDWKTFMEIYFDDYHVEPCHPGLASMADCGGLRWVWAAEGQAQVVGAAAAAAGGTTAHGELSRQALRALGQEGAGAVWAALYPATMIEWLAGGVALSTLSPAGPGLCLNVVDFAYPRGVAARHPGFVEAHQAAYWETVGEDDAIGRRIQQGRAALAGAGRDEAGPVHPELEAGIVKFHDWLAAAQWRSREPDPKGRGPR